MTNAAQLASPSKTSSIFDVDNQITEAGLLPAIRLESSQNELVIPTELAPHKTSSLGKSSLSDDSDSFLLEKPQPSSTLGKVDPIAEAPRLVWYYRSKDFGEKGPLKAKQIQAELDEQNLTIGCIVWREDWEDWQPAEKVFPTLVALAEANEAKRLMRDARKLIPDELNPHSEFRRRQRQRRLLGMAAIATGICIAGALLYYLWRLTSP